MQRIISGDDCDQLSGMGWLVWPPALQLTLLGGIFDLKAGHWKWRMKNGLSGYSVGLLSITNSQQGRKGEKWNTSVNMYAWSWKKNLMVKTALAVAGVCSCDHLYPYRNSNRKPKLEFTWLQEQTRWTIAASNWEYIRWYFRRQHLLCHLSDKKWRIFIDHACICGAKYYFYLNAKCNPI